MFININDRHLSISKKKAVAYEIKAHYGGSEHLKPYKRTEISLIYDRPARKWGAKKKAVAAGIIAFAVWGAYNALVMTDLKDTKPTVSFLTQGQP